MVFEIRKRPEADGPEYQEHLAKLSQHLAKAPGFISAVDWRQPDGTEINLIRFAAPENLAAFRTLADHLLAQKRGRESFFESYRVEVYEPARGYVFARGTGRHVLSLPSERQTG